MYGITLSNKSSNKSSIMEMAVEQSEYSVVITTADLDPPGPAFVYVNAAFTRITGYTREEVLGRTPRMLQGPATDRAVLDRLKSHLLAGDSFNDYTWNYAKDGTPYQVEWTVTPLRLQEHGVDYFFSVQRDVTRLYQTEENLKYETRRLNALLESVGADHDPITGALSHRGMLLQLQHYIDERQSSGSVTGLVSMQLRRLERVDQAYGLEPARQLLSEIGKRLGNRLEAGESLARSHEHTFAIVIAVDSDAVSDTDGHLMARARDLVAAITEEGFEVAGNAFRIELGAGIARAPTDSRHAHELAVLAEEASQRAANIDVEPICWPDHTTMAAQRRQLALEGSLQHAVAEREMTLFYQPIMDLVSNAVVGAEALLRWPQPQGHASIGPDQFIPLAEELGLMDRLGMQVFEDACAQLRRWQERPGNAEFWVSVNVAPAQLRDPDLVDRLIAVTQATGVSPACVKLEITESALEYGLDDVSHITDRLVTAGFPLALDDFGKGYSSLGRLIHMPFDILKVDRAFVWQTPDGRGAGIVASLAQLSSHLQLHALGEGVETAAHEAFLRDCSYRYAQGFYYARPMAAADFEAWSGWEAD